MRGNIVEKILMSFAFEELDTIAVDLTN